MSEDSKAQDIVREMARLAMLSNKLSEMQVKNLQMYPFVFFEGVSGIKMDYDFSNEMDMDTTEDKKELNVSYKVKPPEIKHLRVRYYLTLDEKADNSNIEKRFKAIETSVRQLLWKQISVEVYFNDNLKYKSK